MYILLTASYDAMDFNHSFFTFFMEIYIFYSFQKHNLIFLRFHDISNDIRQRGRRGKYSFDYEKLQKGQRASQMLQLKEVVKGPEDTKLKVIYFWHRQYYTKWTP